MSDPYSILGVEKTASDEQIKTAFRKLAMEYHPDRNPDNPQAVEQFQKISAAYETLKDPAKRAAFDHPQNDFHFRSGNPFDFNFGFGQGGPINMDDLFRNFMNQQSRPQNRSFNIQCQIDQLNAFTGCEVQFNMNGQELRVKIPRGVDNGSRIRVPGAGENIHQDVPPGDIFVLIRVVEHPIFKRDNRNIHTKYTLDTIDAILGTKITVYTIDEQQIEIDIPAKTQQHQQLVLPKCGMPMVDGDDDSRGDHIVTIELRTPTDLSIEQINLLHKIRDLQNS